MIKNPFPNQYTAAEYRRDFSNYKSDGLTLKNMDGQTIAQFKPFGLISEQKKRAEYFAGLAAKYFNAAHDIHNALNHIIVAEHDNDEQALVMAAAFALRALELLDIAPPDLTEYDEDDQA